MFGFFDEEALKKVSAEAFLREHDFAKKQSVVAGVGVDDMTPEERFQQRKTGIGGSEVPELFGVGFNGPSGPSIQFDKKFRECPEEISPEKQRMFDQGHFSENQIFQMVEEILPEGWKAVKDKERYADVERPYCFADFDMILVSPEGEEFVGEIKSYMNFPGRPKIISGEFGQGGTLPHDGYAWQVRYYMYERNVRAAIVFSAPMAEFDASKMAITTIYRDFKKEDAMLAKIDDFWLNHVKKGIRPEVTTLSKDGLNSAKSTTIKAATGEEIISLPKQLVSVVEEITEIENKVSDLNKQHKLETEKLEERKNALTLSLLENMGEAKTGFIETPEIDYTIDRVSTSRSSVDKAALKKKYPEIFKEVESISVSEKIKIKTNEKI